MQSQTQAALWAMVGVVWALGQGCASVSQVGLAPLPTPERVKPVRLETPEAALRHARDVRKARHEVPRFAHRWYPALPTWRGRQRVEAARALATTTLPLELGLRDLDTSEAEQLAKIPAALTLHQLEELSPEAARAQRLPWISRAGFWSARVEPRQRGAVEA